MRLGGFCHFAISNFFGLKMGVQDLPRMSTSDNYE
jgi:hypothetical protein